MKWNKIANYHLTLNILIAEENNQKIDLYFKYMYLYYYYIIKYKKMCLKRFTIGDLYKMPIVHIAPYGRLNL